MNIESLQTDFDELIQTAMVSLSSGLTYLQLAVIFVIYASAYGLSFKLRHSIGVTHNAPVEAAHATTKLLYRLGDMIFPVLAISLLKISTLVGESLQFSPWLIQTAFTIAILIFVNSLITAFVTKKNLARAFRWVLLPILFLHLIDVLPFIVAVLESMSIELGNLSISAYGVARVVIFGGFLFWLGRESNAFGKAVIKNQKSLDVPTKEVFTKLFEVGLFCIVVLLLMNIMGINLTTFAVFGGALGVGIGLGLQTIASNFISGIIILLDKSLTVGDFVELDDGQKGFVREFRMRYAVLETYDGKDILVPNEKFISSLLTNWTHKDPKQRYRVDFSVPYATDIRQMVEFIKVAVAEHPQVISGEDVPFEERPDCEIDSFGDSGVNMFVEFWMLGIDDGKNRVGGDLMLIIFETLRANGIEIPFPQREVRILNEDTNATSMSREADK
ncbi:mechanosensitive ion channel [Glaciecola sp. MH2013]|uniref:mechanosensitive ion channel family protein n=1 Tax=Glaciecola sp. MH2013 TaxID=2785524 RepID=UPI00189DF6BA|nr:mechanosensitive ion channel domain-containing protein [Glaciecola sp. MH2013]MBF7073546.1 mechanosensitive ion channel [Glaciecola sp. MH2013]